MLRHLNSIHHSRHLWAVVPVKPLGLAKQRLAERVCEDREGVAMSMLLDVLNAVSESSIIKRCLVVTGDERAASAARDRRCEVVSEPKAEGMNSAVRMGVEAARRGGAAFVAVLPADLPLLAGETLDTALSPFRGTMRQNCHNSIAIAPSRDARGTNLLCLEAHRIFPFQYGPDSYAAHLQAILQCNCRAVPVQAPELALDIDHGEDLEEFLHICAVQPAFRSTHTYRLLTSPDYGLAGHQAEAG